MSRFGTYNLFTIQFSNIAQTPHGYPNASMIPESKEQWGFVGESENMIKIAEPWEGVGNDHKPIYRDSWAETHDTQMKTGYFGWWNLSYAILALKRLRETPVFVTRDGYTRITNRYERKFRIVQITVSKEMKILSDFEDAVDIIVELAEKNHAINLTK